MVARPNQGVRAVRGRERQMGTLLKNPWYLGDYVEKTLKRIAEGPFSSQIVQSWRFIKSLPMLCSFSANPERKPRTGNCSSVLTPIVGHSLSVKSSRA
jgi:hypothetical protein